MTYLNIFMVFWFIHQTLTTPIIQQSLSSRILFKSEDVNEKFIESDYSSRTFLSCVRKCIVKCSNLCSYAAYSIHDRKCACLQCEINIEPTNQTLGQLKIVRIPEGMYDVATTRYNNT